MPSKSYIEIKGLDALKNSINVNRINKEIAIGVGRAILLIHSELKSSVERAYRTPGSLDSVLIGKSASTQQLGANIIRGGLAYANKPINLAAYNVDFYKGNIPPLPKRREGTVHVVEIVRGRRKIVYGKTNRGGFIPRTASGSIVRFGKKGVMLERLGKSRYPVRTLYGPSLSDMVGYVWDTPRVRAAVNSATDKILDLVEL